MRKLLFISCIIFYSFYFLAARTASDAKENIKSGHSVLSKQTPNAEFISYYTGMCLGNSTEFIDQSTGNIVSWEWEFPGGTPSTSTEQNPWVNYNQEGVFNVTLTVTDINGDTSTLTKVDMITVVGPPQPTFDYTLSGRTVNFNNTTDSIPWGVYYNWSFGDGNTSNLKNPTHTYAQDGNYTVLLEASGECGYNTFELDILIGTPPQSIITATPTEGCKPMQVFYDASSSVNATSYYWEFEGGDPATSTEVQPSVTYYSAGNFDVQLITENQYFSDTLDLADHIQVGTSPTSDFVYIIDDLTVEFTNLSSHFNIVQYHFGDGNKTEAEDPFHTYATDGVYTVQLISINNCGRDTLEMDIEISALPKAGFNASNSSICEQNSILFDAENLSINAIDFLWEFEEGSPSSSSQATETVTYDSSGLYDVSLIVSNHLGSDTLVMENYIEVKNLPSGNIEHTIDEFTASFESSAMHYDSLIWDFGDGNESHEIDPVHIYEQEGSYEVKLEIFSECDTLKRTQVVEVYVAPEAGFQTDVDSNCPPLLVQFYNNSSGNAHTFSWVFEGGRPAESSEKDPLISYTEPGLYDVQLIAISNGGSDTLLVEDTIEVFPLPKADFIFEIDSTNTVRFTNLSTQADSFYWYFGDLSSTIERDPVHTYQNSGEFEVLLIAINECKEDTLRKIVAITTTSVNTELFESVVLYPNPSSYNLVIENVPYGSMVHISDPLGNKVWQKANINSGYLHMDDLQWPGGLYYVTIISHGERKAFKWMLQK